VSTQSVLPSRKPFAKDAQGKAELTVWRFEVPAGIDKDQGFHLEMPAGAEILYVRRGTITSELRALVNTGMPPERRYFYAIKDQWALPTVAECEKALGAAVAGVVYVKSWIVGGVDWHLFEVTGVKAEEITKPMPFEAQGKREPGAEG
jgi:hypothetical protein